MRNLLSYHWAPAPEPTPFTPGANTIMYFPFISDANDYSGNNYVLSTSGTQETIGRRFNTQVSHTKSVTQLSNFISFWMKLYDKGGGGSNAQNSIEVGPTTGYLSYITYANFGTPESNDKIRFVYNSYWNEYKYVVNATVGQWYHIVLCYANPGGAWCFVNGEKHQLTTNTANLSPSVPTTDVGFIGNTATTKIDVALSDVISETTAWSDADVLAYFNATKSKYGVS